MEAGEEFNIKPTGPSDIRRIEGAIFNWGADMTYENNPIEMGLDRLVDWDLPDDACISLAALQADPRRRASSRKINGVEIDGDPFPALNNVKWPVTDGGAEIGKVTSAIYSPRLEKNIGYAGCRPGCRRSARRSGRERVGDADGDGRRDAVRRPGQAHPCVVRRARHRLNEEEVDASLCRAPDRPAVGGLLVATAIPLATPPPAVAVTFTFSFSHGTETGHRHHRQRSDDDHVHRW